MTSFNEAFAGITALFDQTVGSCWCDGGIEFDNQFQPTENGNRIALSTWFSGEFLDLLKRTITNYSSIINSLLASFEKCSSYVQFANSELKNFSLTRPLHQPNEEADPDLPSLCQAMTRTYYAVGYNKFKSQTTPFRQRDFKGVILRPMITSIGLSGVPSIQDLRTSVQTATRLCNEVKRDLRDAGSRNIHARFEAGVPCGQIEEFLLEFLLAVRELGQGMFFSVPSLDLAEHWGILAGSLIKASRDSYLRVNEARFVSPAELVTLASIDCILDSFVSTGQTLGFVNEFLWGSNGLHMMKAIRATGAVDWTYTQGKYAVSEAAVLTPEVTAPWTGWAGSVYLSLGRAASNRGAGTIAVFWQELGLVMESLSVTDLATSTRSLMAVILESYWGSVCHRAGQPVDYHNVPIDLIDHPNDIMVRDRAQFVKTVFSTDLLKGAGYKTCRYLKVVKCVESSLVGTVIGRHLEAEGMSFLDYLSASLGTTSSG